MDFFPKNKQQWLRILVFPFKAYVVAAPILFCISSCFPRPRHYGATEGEESVILFMFPCAVVLIFGALVLALFRFKREAMICAGFGIGGLIVGYLLLPPLARA